MGQRYSSAAAAGVALLAGILAAWLLALFGPPAAADVSRGTEEAFATGLHPRELLPDHGPLRWTSSQASVHFRNVPEGTFHLEVRAVGHRTPVRVVVDGVVVAVLPSGEEQLGFDIGAKRRELTVTLDTEGFVAAGGRRLGTQLRRVALSGPGGASWLAGAGLGTAAMAVALGALATGAGSGLAAALGLVAALTMALALWPGGALWSPYLARLAGQVIALALLATLFARWQAARQSGAAPYAYVAMLAAGLVQGIWAIHPAMVVSDAVFHANKLAQVAGGDLFPTSVTQHATPFRIPYGVSFYLLLAPLARAGVDPVWLVRWGAAASGIAMSAAVFLLLRRKAALALAAVCGLQLLPGVFDLYSYGNLSNVFAQSLTVLLFAWWASRSHSVALGGTLVALAALAHLSGLIVLGSLIAALLWMDERDDAWRPRLFASAIGLAGAAAYYASFGPLIFEQLPRLLEGGGQGRGASWGPTGALHMQVVGALGQWGFPALLLAWWGRPRRPFDRLGRQLAGFWLAGGALFLLALVSPLEVRYIYALTLPLAVAAAAGFLALHRRGAVARAGAWLLAGAQAIVAGSAILDAVIRRYRA